MFLHPGRHTTALVDADRGGLLTHDQLATAIAERCAAAPQGGGAVFLFADTSVDTVVEHLAALRRGAPLALLDPTLPSSRAADLVNRYRPAVVVGAPHGTELPGYSTSPELPRRHLRDGAPAPAHPQLALLLSTSGSTGSPKFVRLSRAALLANTAAIIGSLGLTDGDTAVTTLPLHYSYGMSVLNTHLAAGGSVVLTSRSLVEAEFWSIAREHAVTTLAGVPYTYHLLRRLAAASTALPSLRLMTQAGGRLEPAVAEHVHRSATDWGGDFCVMYGQTEAGPRMACLPSTDFPHRPGSVGLPLAGGSFAVHDEAGRPVPAGTDGEIVYTGPNVMMGYAQEPADLLLGDVIGGVLRTGDVGHVDDDGYLYVTGRVSRIGKVYGMRVSLDEVEGLVQGGGPVAVVAGPDYLVVHCEWPDESSFPEQRRRLARELRLPATAIRFRRVDHLPTTPNGKIDYRGLESTGRRT